MDTRFCLYGRSVVARDAVSRSAGGGVRAGDWLRRCRWYSRLLTLFGRSLSGEEAVQKQYLFWCASRGREWRDFGSAVVAAQVGLRRLRAARPELKFSFHVFCIEREGQAELRRNRVAVVSLEKVEAGREFQLRRCAPLSDDSWRLIEQSLRRSRLATASASAVNRGELEGGLNECILTANQAR